MRMSRIRKALCLAITLVLFTAVTVALAGVSYAAFAYSIPKQQDQLTINPDGSVTLVKYFEFKVLQTSSDSGTEIWAGLPTSGTKISSVVDEDGKAVKFSTRSSGGEYVVTLTGFSIKPGTQKGFTVTATIPNFIFKDTRNAGYVTMQYTPGWWSAPVAVQDIAVIMPGKVEKAEIKTGSRLWDGIAQLESGAYVVSWQFKDLKSNEKVSINVGIPDKYVTLPAQTKPTEPTVPPTRWTPSRPGFDFSSIVGLVIVGFGLLVVFGAISNRAREEYSSPQVSMEGVGVNETLSPVEASVLLRQPPEKTLTLLMFSLVKKGISRVTSQDPLRVAIMYERDLSEAETLFVQAVDRGTGEVVSSKLVDCFKYLSTSVNEKMRPYCRKETEDFYRGVIRRTWDEFAAAQTPELKLSAMDKDFLWLLQDEDRMRDAESQLPHDARGDAVPDWWMMGFMLSRPYGYYYMWPGAIYGNYTGISGGLLGNEESQRFRTISEQIWTPARPPAPTRIHRGGGGGISHGGGFTPPSCACACACVSCACACACAGGGGCT